MCEPMSSQYYYKELDKKNQYIYELKNRINNYLMKNCLFIMK